MASELTAEKLAQRALDVNIVTERDLRSVWGELGTRNVECEQFKQLLLRKGLVTNFQLERLAQNFRTGFFYGDYKVLYLVGAGTFARVYRATHKVNNDLYAIKVLRKSMSEIPEEVELFRREGQLGMKLKHSNIVAIHEVASQGKSHFIVMDFVEGHNLRDFFKVRGKFEPMAATKIVTGMMAGLNYAFQQGVTHRDLKMSNVIISSSGQAKLVDFGLAGLGGSTDDPTDSANPRAIDYAGLERSTSVRRDDTRSDIFFAGCIFYQLLCGKPAMSETRDRAQRLNKSRYKDIKPISDIDPSVPLPLVRIVNKAIEFDPERRYQTPGEMLADLKLTMKRMSENGGFEAKDSAEAAGPQEGHSKDGQPIRLMVLESDTKMQDVFRKLFKKLGYRVLVMSDSERLFQRIYEDAKIADVLLLSSGQIGEEAMQAFVRLGNETGTKHLPAILLLGETQSQWKKKLPTDSHRYVLQMPVKSKQLRAAVLKVISNANST